MGRGSGQLDLGLGAAPEAGFGEAWARRRGLTRLVGLDEVGRGPLAGPVVAGAAWLPSQALEARLLEAGLTDSKRLTAKRREALAALLREEAVVAVGEVSAARIDEVNILQATFEAMRLALGAVLPRMDAPPDALLVDGNQPLVPSPVEGAVQKTLVKGDARALCIAAASVVAKVHRDALMTALDAEYPGYGFAGNKGYGAPEHLAALARLGPTPVHRRSFRGVLVPGGEDAA